MVGTYNLKNTTLSIVQDMGVRQINLLLVSGTVTVKGVLKIGENESQPITLTSGVPFVANSLTKTLELTINCEAGEANLTLGE